MIENYMYTHTYIYINMYKKSRNWHMCVRDYEWKDRSLVSIEKLIRNCIDSLEWKTIIPFV